MPRWSGPAWVKLHENCGGFVHWREAHEIPGTGWTGECTACHDRSIPVERIIPVRDTSSPSNDGASLRTALEALSRGERANLRWADDRDWDKNQQRLRREILAASGGAVA